MDLVELAQARAAYPTGIPPHVCDLFEDLALQLAASGRRYYSARGLLYVMRFNYDVRDHTSAFKLNDHITPTLARWFLARHPELPDFFELRERINDGYRDDPPKQEDNHVNQ